MTLVESNGASGNDFLWFMVALIAIVVTVVSYFYTQDPECSGKPKPTEMLSLLYASSMGISTVLIIWLIRFLAYYATRPM